MNLFALFVFHQKKKKRKRNREWAAATRRQPPVPSRPVFPHTSPQCISDTGRHFSALHTYFYIHLFCMDMYCCMCRVASRRCCVHLFLACGCLCVTVSAAHATSLCLPGLVHCTIFHIPTHISTHEHIHPMSVCYSSCCNRWQKSSGQLLISQFVFAFNISIQCEREREREREIRKCCLHLSFLYLLRVLFFYISFQ